MSNHHHTPWGQPPPGQYRQPPPPAHPQRQPDVLGQLRRLGELHQEGVLTEEEFNTKKSELLSRPSQQHAPQHPQGGYPPQQHPPSGWGQPPSRDPRQAMPAKPAEPPKPMVPGSGLGTAAAIVGMLGVLVATQPRYGEIGFVAGVLGAGLGFAGVGNLRAGKATNTVVTYGGLVAGVVAAAMGLFGFVTTGGLSDQPDEDPAVAGGDQVTAGDATPGDDAPEQGVPAGAAISPEDVVPVGQLVPVGEWAVAVQPANFDASEIIEGVNRFNRSPGSGETFVMARVDVRYDGEGSARPGFDLSIDLIGAQGQSYGFGCGQTPNDFDDIGTLPAGGTAAGNHCVEADIDALNENAVWEVKTTALSGTHEVVYFALK